MAKYQDRINRKKKFKAMKETVLHETYFLWLFAKRVLKKPCEFSQYVRNDLRNQLDNGATEVRYYKAKNVRHYDSLFELFIMFCKEYNRDLYYSGDNVFEGVYKMIMLDFSKYLVTNNKGDLNITKEKDEYGDYILIQKV